LAIHFRSSRRLKVAGVTALAPQAGSRCVFRKEAWLPEVVARSDRVLAWSLRASVAIVANFGTNGVTTARGS
jgi:hypothetical protein